MSQYNEVILPESVYQSVRSFSNYVKRTSRIEPQGSSADIGPNQQVEFALPTNTLVDISSFAVVIDGITFDGTNTALPAFADSFIQRLEILSNGNTIQVINNYNVLMNVMRNLAEGTDHATSYAAVYGGAENFAAASGTGNTNIISNWCGFLGSRKIIDISSNSGMMDLRVRLTISPSSILASDTATATFLLKKMYATVNVVAMSEPSLEAAIKSLNGTPEIAFDYVQNYSDSVSSGGALNMKVPVVASSLKHIVLTSRRSNYNTIAAKIADQPRTLYTTQYFKFDGSNVSNLILDTGSGLMPSSALNTAQQQAYYTMEGLGVDDNWAVGGWGLVKGTAGNSALDTYKNYSWATVFSFSHRDAPQNLLIGYNTKSHGTFLIKADQAGANAYQYDAFTVSSAVLTLKPGQWALQV